MEIVSLEAPKKIKRREVDDLQKLREHEVRVRIKRVSLCGSDYKLYRGKYNGPNTYPIVFGHEWAGEVIAIGAKVSKVEMGDHVTGDCSKYCGVCGNCTVDRNLCQRIDKFGLTIDGYSQQEVIVHEKYLYKADRTVSFKALALAEPIAVACHALSAHPCHDTKQKVLVLGCGAIGIAAYLLLKYEYGYTNLFISDLNIERIKLLQQIVGEPVNLYHYASEDKRKDYQEMYAGNGFDLICEMTGHADAFREALERANPMSVILTVGMYGEMWADLGLITMKRLTVQGSIGGTGEFERVLEFCKKYSHLVEQMVTSEYSYQQCEEAFEKSRTDPRNIKTQLIF